GPPQPAGGAWLLQQQQAAAAAARREALRVRVPGRGQGAARPQPDPLAHAPRTGRPLADRQGLLRVAAVDWSGRVSGAERFIWTAVASPLGELVSLEDGRDRTRLG